jgi:hypothetical protein
MHDVMIGVGGLAQGKKKGKGKGGSKTSAVQSAKEAVQAMHPPPGAAGTSKARAAPAAVAGGGPSKVYTPSALDEARSLSAFDMAELEEKLDAAAAKRAAEGIAEYCATVVAAVSRDPAFQHLVRGKTSQPPPQPRECENALAFKQPT